MADEKSDPQKGADRGAAAMKAYAAIYESGYEGRVDPETALADLLGDLMHWAAARGVSFEQAAERAAGYFRTESGG